MVACPTAVAGRPINWATLIADGCEPIEAAVETIVGTTSDGEDFGQESSFINLQEAIQVIARKVSEPTFSQGKKRIEEAKSPSCCFRPLSYKVQ